MFQFKDNSHTPAGILADIKKELAKQPLTDPPEFAPFNAGISTSSTIQVHLDEITALQTEMATNVDLAPSPTTRIPILGQLWKLIRAEVHNLPLFYVNRHATTTTKINQHLSTALTQLAQLNQSQAAQIEKLEAEVAQLRREQDRSA